VTDTVNIEQNARNLLIGQLGDGSVGQRGGGVNVRRGNMQTLDKKGKKEEAVKKWKKAENVDSKLCAEIRT
jgi:hypothetical protein